MPFRLGVLVIHGMGSQDASFADAMIERLKRQVRRLGGRDADICFQTVWWAPVLAQRQSSLLRELADGNELDWMQLRRFVMHSLADAVAYQDVPTSADQINVYGRVHAVIADAVLALERRTREGKPDASPDVPIVVLAHSLGGHMISNFIWDTRHPKPGRPAAETPFRRFESLAGIVTFGCNIPVFMLAYNEIHPIEFPHPSLPDYFPGVDPAEVRRAARWLNLYDPDDVLAYPLRPLNAAYREVVTADIAVNVGNLLRSWNPASHDSYWDDRDTINPTAEMLRDLLRLVPGDVPIAE